MTKRGLDFVFESQDHQKMGPSLLSIAVVFLVGWSPASGAESAPLNKCDGVEGAEDFFPLNPPSPDCLKSSELSGRRVCSRFANDMVAEYQKFSGYEGAPQGYSSEQIDLSMKALQANISLVALDAQSKCGSLESGDQSYCRKYVNAMFQLARDIGWNLKPEGGHYSYGQLTQALGMYGAFTKAYPFTEPLPNKKLFVDAYLKGGYDYLKNSDTTQFVKGDFENSLEHGSFFVATTMPLAIEDFNAISFLPFGPAGLVKEAQKVDGGWYDPHGFTLHDGTHLESRSRKSRVSDVVSHFRCTCQMMGVIESMPSADLKAAGHLLWFDLTHEKFSAPSSRNGLLNALSDQCAKDRYKDYFGAFPASKPTEEVTVLTTSVCTLLQAKAQMLSANCYSGKEQEEEARQRRLVQAARLAAKEGLSCTFKNPTGSFDGVEALATRLNEKEGAAPIDPARWSNVGNVLAKLLVDPKQHLDFVKWSPTQRYLSEVIGLVRRQALTAGPPPARLLSATSLILEDAWQGWEKAVDGIRGETHYRVPADERFSQDDLNRFSEMKPSEKIDYCSSQSNQDFCNYVLLIEDVVNRQRFPKSA